jgi:hypothetical protein
VGGEAAVTPVLSLDSSYLNLSYKPCDNRAQAGLLCPIVMSLGMLLGAIESAGATGSIGVVGSLFPSELLKEEEVLFHYQFPFELLWISGRLLLLQK